MDSFQQVDVQRIIPDTGGVWTLVEENPTECIVGGGGPLGDGSGDPVATRAKALEMALVAAAIVGVGMIVMSGGE